VGGLEKERHQLTMSTRFKILLIPAWYPVLEDPVHGIFIREHARVVAMHCDVVVLYARAEKKPFTKLVKIVSDQDEDGLRTVRVNYYLFNISLLNFLLCNLSIWIGKRYIEKQGFIPDILHAHEFIVGFTAVLMGKISHIPVVISEHWSGFPLQQLNLFSKVIARWAFNNADVVCPVSQNLRQHIEAYGIEANFCVIPNPVNTKLFYPDLNNEPVSVDNKKHFLFIGRLHPIKGLPNLIHAVGKVAKLRCDFVLDIVGDGPKKSEYQELTGSLVLNNFIIFHGGKTPSEVGDYIRKAGFVVIPSEWENLPVVLIESMACGKPIIASAVGGIPEMMEPQVGKLVKPNDIDDLANAIIQMLDSYTIYSAEDISQLGQQKYSYKSVARQYKMMYQEQMMRYGHPNTISPDRIDGSNY
jgi:L-malate glycosyltransferase